MAWSKEILRFAVFHISSRKNRKSINRLGLLSRACLAARRRSYHDIADEALAAKLEREQTFRALSDWGQEDEVTLRLANYVPCHFLKPLHRPEVGPTDVYRWGQAGHELDCWVIDPQFVTRQPHWVCVGHWGAMYWNGPFLLAKIDLFCRWLSNPEKLPPRLEQLSGHYVRFFREDIANILRGRVNTRLLNPGNRYRHLLNSSLFIHESVPPDALLRLDKVADLDNLEDGWTFQVRVSTPKTSNSFR